MTFIGALITLIIFSLAGVRCTSMPEQCQDIPCEEGYFCVVRQVAECSPRFCPPPFPECTAISSKPGVCPYRLENRECLNLRGAPMCFIDEDCTDDKKCCEGCCKTPDAEPNLDEPVELTGTPGMCPVEEDINSLRMWTSLYCPETDTVNDIVDDSVDKCYVDEECEANFKCCTGLCGNRCKRALSVSVPGRASRR